MNRITLLLLLSFVGEAFAGTAGVTETRTALGQFHPWRNTVVVSPHAKRAAWQRQSGVRGDEFHVVLDGAEGPAFDRVEHLTFSPDDSRFFYIGYAADHVVLVIDGKPEPPYKDVHDATFSPDSRHVLYIARVSGDKEILAVDGREMASYRYIRSPVYSPDGTEIALDGLKGDSEANHVIVRNGVESAKGGPLHDLSFSPDGKHLVAIRRQDDGEHLVYDGSEGPAYRSVGNILWSPDGHRLAYSAWNPDQSLYLVVDGIQSKTYASMMRASFSPDGRHFVGTMMPKGALQAGKLQMIQLVDDKEIGPVSQFGPARFSPDSSRLAFMVGRGQSLTMWVDGVEEQSFVQCGLPEFSPDSKHLAYEVRYQQKFGEAAQAIVFDGKPGIRFDFVGGSTFSPDSRRLAFCALRRRADPGVPFGHRVVVDSVEGEPYDEVSDPVFSPDSKHCAYLARLDQKWFAVIDGLETKPVDGLIRNCPLVFDAPANFHFLAIEGGNLQRVAVQLTGS